MHTHLYTHSNTHTLTHTLTHIHTHYLSHAHTRTPMCLCLRVCGCSHAFVRIYVRICACVYVCVRVCVFACVQWLNGSPDPTFSKHSIFILDTGETQDIIYIPGQGHWLEFTYCVLREGVFRCARRGYLWVCTSEEIFCCQLQAPCFSENTNTPKIIQNTRKCCLGHATNVRFSFRLTLLDVFPRTQPRQMPYHSKIFARKPGWCIVQHSVTQQSWHIPSRNQKWLIGAALVSSGHYHGVQRRNMFHWDIIIISPMSYVV